MPKGTPNFWSSDIGYDAVVADYRELHDHGVGEGLLFFPIDPQEFLNRMSMPLARIEPIEDSAWFEQRVPFVPLLAALHWDLQIPREMLVKHAIALSQVMEKTSQPVHVGTR